MRLLFTCLAATTVALSSAAGAQSAADAQIAAAVLPLPTDLRASATVLGYGPDGKLVTLRRGEGGMTCLADAPNDARTHVACYHNSLEPFMARGRALRAEGVVGAQVDTVRYREIAAGTLAMPKGPAMLYSITAGAANAYDAKQNVIVGGNRLYVTYIPYATTLSTGISTTPKTGEPWLMFPGTPKAHIMFTPGM
jgi:hypothetical protein